MRHCALVCDYDETIAREGRVEERTLEALQRVRSSGRKVLLVTGRTLKSLLSHLEDPSVFDLIVAENGALLYEPATKEQTPLAEPPPAELVDALRARGVPLAVGHTVIATETPHEMAALEEIQALGLEYQIIFNKGAVMVLPAGVNKATGLEAALERLGLSPHNATAIGDAENDHAMLALCECAIAVANALPAVKERADYVTQGEAGAGVSEIIELLIEHDLADLDPYLERHHVLLGHREDGSELKVPPWGFGLLFTGSSGGGKSTAMTGLLERIAARGYQFCIVDPEGDYESFSGAVVLGDNRHEPPIEEVLDVLRSPSSSAIVNLLGVGLADRPAYFARLLPRLQEMRAGLGRPHWLVIDEAHHLMPADREMAANTLPQELYGTMLITVHPDLVCRAVLASMGTVVTVGKHPERALAAFAAAVGEAAPHLAPAQLEAGEALVWRRGGQAPERVSVVPAEQELKRHSRKYAEGNLGPDRSFYFRGPEGKLNLQAENLQQFSRIGEGVDDETWLYHLRAGDYSRWFRDVIKDDEMGDEVQAIEREPDIGAGESRRRVREAIEARYTLPADEPSGWESADHETVRPGR